MGIFDKLFGSSKVSTIDKSSEMLNEEVFWNLIEESIKKSDDQESQESYIIKKLQKLTPKEIIGFRLRTDKLLFDTYNSEMWCAGYLMNQGCSDDCFEYFRNWIISRGKDVYYAAKENPDSLITEKEFGGDDMFEFETFWYVALEAFQNKTGKDLYEFIDYDNFKTSEGNYPQFDFNWEDNNPESMKKICPKLFDEFWGD